MTLIARLDPEKYSRGRKRPISVGGRRAQAFSREMVVERVPGGDPNYYEVTYRNSPLGYYSADDRELETPYTFRGRDRDRVVELLAERFHVPRRTIKVTWLEDID